MRSRAIAASAPVFHSASDVSNTSSASSSSMAYASASTSVPVATPEVWISGIVDLGDGAGILLLQDDTGRYSRLSLYDNCWKLQPEYRCNIDGVELVF